MGWLTTVQDNTVPSLFASGSSAGPQPRIGALLLPLLLGACGQQGESGVAAAGACAAGENLIRDARFTTLDAPRFQRAWLSSQHSSDVAFEYQAEQGVLTITRTGDEPWFVLGQDFEGGQWGGKRVRFSAELKMELTPPEPGHGFRKGGGLLLRARQGGRIVFNSEFEHDPHMGRHDWQRVSVTGAIPPRADSLRAGFQHQAGGRLQARNPELTIIAPGCP